MSDLSSPAAAGPRPEAPAAVAEALRCPRCHAPVAPTQAGYRCPAGHEMRWEGGVLDATGNLSPDDESARTFASFGYEWTTFDQAMPEDEQYADHYLQDLDLGSLHGRLGLDAGCGRGRYARFLAPHLGALVALDGSDAVVSAARNLAGEPNTVVVRADLRQAPFARHSFGFVASLGVLHHLADPRRGFEELVELLAPGGTLLLYLYSRPAGAGTRRAALAAAGLLRRATTRMPHRALRALCGPLAAALYAGVVAPGRLGDARGIERLAALPMATYRDKPLRSLVLDTFDRLSAPIEHRYVWAELAPWFEQAGLVVEAARDESGWFVVARKPSDPGLASA